MDGYYNLYASSVDTRVNRVLPLHHCVKLEDDPLELIYLLRLFLLYKFAQLHLFNPVKLHHIP